MGLWYSSEPLSSEAVRLTEAVVLLDEADVFLEQRSLTSLERNALVSGTIESKLKAFLQELTKALSIPSSLRILRWLVTRPRLTRILFTLLQTDHVSRHPPFNEQSGRHIR